MTAMAVLNSARAESRAAGYFNQATSVRWKYGMMAFWVLHVPLALLIQRSSNLSTLHGVLALGVGLWCVLTTPERSLRVAYVAAYITGAEVLWRMTGSHVFWEFGKYSIAAMFLLSILRSARQKGPRLMVGYFLLLLPSIGFLVTVIGVSRARGAISANLSGPLALMTAAWFFSRLKFSFEDLQRILLFGIAPIIGIASITFFGIYSAKEIHFTGASNFETSGGFGPNQVSAALGLGAFFAIILLLISGKGQLSKPVLLVVMLFLAVQSALTFSRGGLYNAAGAVVIASIYFLRDSRTRRALLLLTVSVVLIGSFVILPRLNSLTGGALEARFTKTDSTHRADIVLEDVYLFLEYPVLGVGPGGSRFADATMAHTEFARMPAEHGILGLIALILLLVAAIRTIQNAKSTKAKAVAASLVAWSFLYMLNAAMRVVAPSFVFGLAFATISSEDSRRLVAVLSYWRARLRLLRSGDRQRTCETAHQ
jgi:hypothetical protein